MRGARSRARFAATMGLALAGLCAFALNPAQDVSQYAHDLWTYRQGLAQSYIHSIVQTPDGYLWLGTESGLLRFDAVRSSAWEPQVGQSLPSSNLTTLLAARDGTLWIGSRNGLVSRKNGILTQYADLAGLAIFALLEDRESRIWVGAYGLPKGKFCEIGSGGVRCHPEAGSEVVDLQEDTKGNLWAFTDTGIWRWKPGPPKFYPLVLKDSSHRMADGGNGALMVGMKGGVGRFADGKLEMAYPFPALMRGPVITKMLRDRDGGLWVGTRTGGVVHIHQGHTDAYSRSDGLTSDNVTGLFEDREGNVWVATTNGLDRFRELPVTAYSVSQGLSSNFISTVLGAKDGTIWIGVPSGLDRLSGDKVTAFRLRSVPAKAASGEIAVSGMPDGSLESLFQDSRGRIWVSSATAVGYLEGTRFIPSGVPGGDIFALTEDTAGNIWIANQDLGLYRLSPSDEVQRIPWERLGRQGPGTLLAADPVHGGLWIGFFGNGIAEWRDGQVHASYSASNGLGHGRINHLRFEKNGALWAATEGGLSRLKDGRIATLSNKNGLPCDAVHWTIEDDAQSVWLKMPCGLVRVAQSELEAWAAATDRTIHVAVFDGTDGVRLNATAGSISPPVAKKDGNGRLWFVSPEGIGVETRATFPTTTFGRR